VLPRRAFCIKSKVEEGFDVVNQTDNNGDNRVPKPNSVPTDEPSHGSENLPNHPENDEELSVPAPLAPELMPIGDPAGAA
jgi:hypothetical protein